MDQPLPARTLNEAWYYLRVTACGYCRHARWEIDSTAAAPEDDQVTEIAAHCGHCGRRHAFRFDCPGHQVPDGPQAEQINPQETPSRIVDLAQWLGLFQMLVESAASQTDKAGARRVGLRAALCLEEALKFYQDQELPPESAFFSAETLAVFREHPEKFARRRLIDMRSKLPATHAMTRQVDRDRRATVKRWWQFWK